jgi:hypothetical protein
MGDVGQRQAPMTGGYRSDLAFREVEGTFVFLPDGRVEKPAVAKAHLSGAMFDMRVI